MQNPAWMKNQYNRLRQPDCSFVTVSKGVGDCTGDVVYTVIKHTSNCNVRGPKRWGAFHKAWLLFNQIIEPLAILVRTNCCKNETKNNSILSMTSVCYFMGLKCVWESMVRRSWFVYSDSALLGSCPASICTVCRFRHVLTLHANGSHSFSLPPHLSRFSSSLRRFAFSIRMVYLFAHTVYLLIYTISLFLHKIVQSFCLWFYAGEKSIWAILEQSADSSSFFLCKRLPFNSNLLYCASSMPESNATGFNFATFEL